MKQDNKKEQTEPKQPEKRPNHWGGTLTLKGIKKTKKK